MKFTDVEYGYQAAFSAAWGAYKRDTTPIGCAIIDDAGNLLTKEENSIYASDGRGIITGHNLAHAEINAVLQINAPEHPNIGKYTLYSTLEPCLFCYSAIIQNRMRHVKFAAYDKNSGATDLITEINPASGMIIKGPDKVLQILQIILIIFRRLEKDFSHNSNYIEMYKSYCPEGVGLGRRLFSDGEFQEMVYDNKPYEDIFDYILGMYT